MFLIPLWLLCVFLHAYWGYKHKDIRGAASHVIARCSLPLSGHEKWPGVEWRWASRCFLMLSLVCRLMAIHFTRELFWKAINDLADQENGKHFIVLPGSHIKSLAASISMVARLIFVYAARQPISRFERQGNCQTNALCALTLHKLTLWNQGRMDVHSGMFLSLFKMQNCFFSTPSGNSFKLSYASLFSTTYLHSLLGGFNAALVQCSFIGSHFYFD